MTIKDINSGKFREIMAQNNNVFKTITHSREQLNDAEIFKKQTKILMSTTSKMDDMSR